MKVQKTTFAIIGGGIAGLSTAIALKKMGIEATVFEAAPEFKPIGAGIMLAVNAMKAYEHLGIYQEILNAGEPFNGLMVLNQSGKVLSKANTTELENRYTNVAIHRAALHEVLLSQLDQSKVITGKRSVDINISPEGNKVTFEDGTWVIADYVIVAEGIHSPIRRKLLPQSQKRYSGYTCWRGIADNIDTEVKTPSETWGKNGRFGMVPLANNKVYWFAVKNAPENSDEIKKYRIVNLLYNYKNYHHLVNKVISATNGEHLILNDIHDLNPINQYAFYNNVLIGDAAHATTPNMGQGACQAIEDAVVLANCLKNNSSVANAFKSFETKRLKRTHFIVNQSWKLGKIAQWENPLAIGLRNFIFRSMPASVTNKQIKNIYDFRI